MRHSRSMWSVLIGAGCVMWMSMTPAYSQTTATLGKIVPGAIPSSGLSADTKRVSRVTLSGSGTLSKLCGYLDGKGGVSGYQRYRFVLYRDSNGVPGSKVLESDEQTVLSDDRAAWVCRGVPLTPVPAGSYWIGIHTAGTAGVIRDYYDADSTAWYSNADPFDDGASSPFGTGTAGTGSLTVYAEYFPDSQMRAAGRTTVGTLHSGGMTADFKRGSSFVLPERGKLYAITAYLDGLGKAGTADVQRLHYLIYSDANGAPGTKVYEGADLYLRAGSAPAWITQNAYAAQAPTLEAGRYWVVFHTDVVTGVVRNYADGTGNWYGNSDTFSDGASQQFGAGNTGNGTISAFISYRPGTITSGAFGRTDIATNPSKGLSANVDRFSWFWLDDNAASLTGLHAYLDGLGAATGSQKVRMVIYELWADELESYFFKLAESNEVTISAGMPPQWVHFTVPAVPLEHERNPPLYPGYLIGIQTGDTAGVVRDYGDARPDERGNWRSIADPYADGALDRVPDTLPTAPGSVTLSVYATYSVTPP